MYPWVGSHAPSCGRQLCGAAQQWEYLSLLGAFLPRIYETLASYLWVELRGPAAWQGTPSCAVWQLTCHGLLPWLQLTFAMVPDAPRPGPDQWPWSAAPATGPAGQLGRPSVSDPWGGVSCALSLCCPGCVRACSVQGLSPLVHRCARPLHSVCSVRGHLALFHPCAHCVSHAPAVSGFVAPPCFILFPCLMISSSSLFNFLFRKAEKGRANTTGTGMPS